MAADRADADHPEQDTENPEGDVDLKARFRDALERKRGQQADSVGGPGGRDGKIHEAHSRAGAKRQFRRKSGG
jgi:hypothetical protein